ncbi:MAG TPA: hypothetical protein PK573_11590 [Spirochaetota bacterium]|nr:hypothetical protein [Spirochaetota bacterium]HSA15662.1 hypothetical protein [Spirochaetota bacterium]
MITKQRIYGFMLILFSVLFFCIGCDDAADDGDKTAVYDLEIAGTWSGDYGDETITDSEFSWAGYVREYDNDMNVLFYQAKEDDSYNPNKYGRIVWTEMTESSGVETFYYCTEVYGKDTLLDAKSDPTTSDSSDPANGGCGGFSWTRLSAPVE